MLRLRLTSEHLDEDRLGELVELGEGGAALGAEAIGGIQDRRNPPLLVERRKGDFKIGDLSERSMLDACLHAAND